uniref:Endonuclease/exonuclease/phosphatase domain-containing protein n=1 Tax=Arundo donax TaxID=35708 RepID=A0A0A8XS12_ARUDO
MSVAAFDMNLSFPRSGIRETGYASNWFIMSNQNRNWNILNWNIRGLNSDDKCKAVRANIEESNCAVLCIQETKNELIDNSYMKKLAQKKIQQICLCTISRCLWWNSCSLE